MADVALKSFQLSQFVMILHKALELETHPDMNGYNFKTLYLHTSKKRDVDEIRYFNMGVK